jgi:hypothetical protein
VVLNDLIFCVYRLFERIVAIQLRVGMVLVALPFFGKIILIILNIDRIASLCDSFKAKQ